MTKSRRLILLTAGFLATIALVYVLWPAAKVPEPLPPVVREAAFLETDPGWADSIIQRLSQEELLAQLFFPSVPLSLMKETDSLVFDDRIPQPGGLIWTDPFPGRQLHLTESVLRQQKIPLLLAHTSAFHYASPYFPVADEELFFSCTDTVLQEHFYETTKKLAPGSGSDMVFLPKGKSVHYLEQERVLIPLLNRMSQEHLLVVAGPLNKIYDPVRDSLLGADSLARPWRALCDSGLAVLEIDTLLLRSLAVKKNDQTVRDFCEDQLDFKGILLARFPEGEADPKQLLRVWFAQGIEMIITGTDHFKVYEAAREMLRTGEVTEAELKRRVRKNLLAKSWVRQHHYRTTEDLLSEHSFRHPRGKVFLRQMEESSIVLLNKKPDLFPFAGEPEKKTLLMVMGSEGNTLRRELSEFIQSSMVIRNLKDLSEQKSDLNKKYQRVVLFLDHVGVDSSWAGKAKHLLQWKNLIVFHCGPEQELKYLSQASVLLHSSSHSERIQQNTARVLLGMNSVSGRLMNNIANWKAGSGFRQAFTRIRDAMPEELGISSDSLYRIDGIMEEAIRNRALPGGQVLFVLKGKIIYHRVFGSLTYDGKEKTEATHLYDIASVTKVAATTMMAMHLYERNAFQLDDSLKKHLPDTLKKHLPRGSSLEHVTFRQILIHASGLPAGQNIFRFLRFDEERSPYDSYFCDEFSDQFSLFVGDSFYLDRDCLDTLWIDLNKIWLDPAKPYVYSDANMNLLYTLLSSKLTKKQRWEQAVDSLFYKPLGMKHTTYIPLQKGWKKEQIAPTEKDRFWRKQLVRGHVHDPTAALYGGVAGNAGLFSNAKDLAVLFQMLLNKGEYAGKRYLKKETVETFTSRQPGSHRGLGFNMQVSGNTYGCSPYASGRTFGHTGFTGTAVWADPDLNLIYVFISNRVHPDPENKTIIKLGITKRIHNVVYEQLGFGREDKAL